MNNFKFLNFKFRYLFLFYLVTTILLISCNEKPHQVTEVEPTKQMLAHIIKTEKAISIYQNYEKQRINILKDTLTKLYGDGFNDTRRVWFDLKTLKNYIAYVEKKSAENDIKPEGLQFYFSVYGNMEGKQKNHQTFFIAPTTNHDEKQAGYTLETRDGKTQPLFLKKILMSESYSSPKGQQMNKAGFFSLNYAADEDGLLYNDGDSSPPMDNY